MFIVTSCRNGNFSVYFNTGMMAVSCAHPRNTVVPIAPDGPGIEVSL
jgi:hypothetical protein